MSGPQTVLQVVILRDGLLVGTEVFTPGTYALGSAPSSDVRLEDPAIASRHAVLYFQNGRAAIQDPSGSGVYVNGHRISACEIRSADEVLCGPFILKTRILSQQPGEDRQQPPPEVAALLGAAPPPPTAPGPMPPVARPSSAQRLASVSQRETLPGTVALSPGRRPTRSQPIVEPGQLAPQPPSARAPSTHLYGQDGGADLTIPALPVPPPPPEPALMPASTQPSVRRREPEPVRANGPALQLADELLADLPLGVSTEPAWNEPRPSRATHAPRLEPGRGPAHLYLELYWGAVRREVRRFAPGKPVRAAADESAPMPLWGFALPAEPFTLAESVNEAFRLYVPPGAQVECTSAGGRYTPVSERELEAEGQHRYVTLRQGSAARLTHGELSLVAYAAPLPNKVRVNPLKGLPWLALGSFFFLSSALGAFVLAMPRTPERPDFAQRGIPPVALRLMAPRPQEKEKAQKRLAAIKEKSTRRNQKADKNAQKPVPPAPKQRKPLPRAVAAAPESRALKALEKLSAAGPATNDLLAAVDKLGSGPGSKNAKSSNFKLSGLIGKAPIANAGLGNLGLGGGGKGGGATQGAEILRGKGGGGIGALGAGGVGKGKVGGTVKRATARTISAKGAIDREAVAKVVNSHLQEVHACYERALLRDPGLAGKVVLEWTIGTNGRVTSVKTKSSTLRSPSVVSCILSDLKTWTFPSPRGGSVIITYPFLFNSVGY